jgi:transcriptional regulator with XRE-family HTH domain
VQARATQTAWLGGNVRQVAAKALRDLRHAVALTQAEVAEYVRVSPSQVSRWEQAGGPVPRPGHRRRLAELYGVGPEVIGARFRGS